MKKAKFDFTLMTDGVKGAEYEKTYTFKYYGYDPRKLFNHRYDIRERPKSKQADLSDKQHCGSVPGLRKRKRKSAKHTQEHDKRVPVVQKRKDDHMSDGNWRAGMNPEQETICRTMELLGWRFPCRGCVYNNDKFTCSNYFKEVADNGNQQEQERSEG